MGPGDYLILLKNCAIHVRARNLVSLFVRLCEVILPKDISRGRGGGEEGGGEGMDPSLVPP